MDGVRVRRGCGWRESGGIVGGVRVGGLWVV